MNLFMMYMAGNSLSIWTIMIVGMIIMNGSKGLYVRLTSIKAMRENGSAWTLIVVGILCQGIVLSLGLWKGMTMGLLPNEQDWMTEMVNDDPFEMVYEQNNMNTF